MILKRILLGVILTLTLLGGPAVAVAEPAFGSVVKDGAFEIRDYPALVVAEVTLTGEQKEAASKGFRLLAAYIFGGNRRKQGIAMTAPVTQEVVGEKVAMTAPVTPSQTAAEWVVRFTMPSSYSLETLPQPNDARVRLRVTPPARFRIRRTNRRSFDQDAPAGLGKPRRIAARTTRRHSNRWIALYDRCTERA
jgi:hypothetical protein